MGSLNCLIVNKQQKQTFILHMKPKKWPGLELKTEMTLWKQTKKDKEIRGYKNTLTMSSNGNGSENSNNMIHTHSKWEYGIWPVNISSTVHPKLHISAGSP